MWKALTADSILSYALLGMTAVTGLVDAASFLSLRHVFTANMTGNIVLFALASTGVPQVSVAGSITALLGFLAGAAVGGRIMAFASAVVQLRAASSVFAIEITAPARQSVSSIQTQTEPINSTRASPSTGFLKKPTAPLSR
jgi:uncharacterized membrane protein YoaK (UPF0700 family)